MANCFFSGLLSDPCFDKQGRGFFIQNNYMKIRNIIVLAVFFLSLCQCNKKETDKSYSNEDIAVDNALAAMYFHIVFREAENAWAFIDSMGYVTDKTYTDPASTSTVSKKLTYKESTKEVTVEYHAWVTNDYLLMGMIVVKLFEKNVYRVDGKVANINLKEFSINGQNVVGDSSIKYKTEKDNKNDIYTYSLLNGSAIHEQGYSKPQVISGSISNGRYERTKGGDTPTQDDDEWTFSGKMTGILRETPSLKYTNTVSTTLTYYDKNDVKRTGTNYYSMNCKIAKYGASLIEIPLRPDIVCYYDCSDIVFVSINEVQ